MDHISELKHYLQEKDIHFQILELSSPHIEVRRKAREYLVKEGDDAIQPLLALLHQPDRNLAREAELILGRIDSPKSPRAMVAALQNENPIVGWEATRNLKELGRGAVVALLEALASGESSIWLSVAAREIMSELSQYHDLTREEEKVLDILQDPFPTKELINAASIALAKLKDDGYMENGKG